MRYEFEIELSDDSLVYITIEEQDLQKTVDWCEYGEEIFVIGPWSHEVLEEKLC